MDTECRLTSGHEKDGQQIIMGIGNTMMRDEGIGVQVVDEMQRCGYFPRGYTLAQIGASSFDIVHYASGKRVAVIVDCAYMGEVPGTIRMFTHTEVRSTKIRTGLSLHEGDVLQSIDLLQAIGEMPRQLYFFGIEPYAVEPGDGVTPALARNVFHYVAYVTNKIIATTAKARPVHA